MKKIAKFITGHPLMVIGIIALITVFFIISATRISIETDIKKLLPSNAESVVTFNAIDEEFGGADRMYVIVEDENVFDYETLSKVDALTNEIADISGVAKVMSITNLNEIKAAPDGVEVAPLIEEVPKNKPEIAAFKKKLLADEKYAGLFVAKDSSATLLLVKLYIERDKTIVTEVEKFCKSYEGPEKMYISGSPSVAHAIQVGLVKDLAKLTPLAFGLVTFILFISFRSWFGVILPMICVGLSSIWAFGLMALTGKPLTVVTVDVPVLLASVGSAYGIHVLSRYYEEDSSRSIKEILETVIDKTGIAVFIAAATTMAGFMSNVVSDISAIRTFGFVSAFGIGSAFLITISFIPAALLLLARKRPEAEGKHKEENRILTRALGGLGNFLTTKHKWTMILAALLLVGALVAYPRVTTESDPVRYFNEESEVVKTSNLARGKFGGAMTLDILIEGDAKDPELLRRIEKLQKKMRDIEILSKPYTIVDAIKETHRLMNNNDKRFDVIPDSRTGIAQYLLLLSLSGGDFLQTMISSDRRQILVSPRVNTSVSTKIDKMLVKVKKAINETFGDAEDVSIKLSGMSVIIKDMREMLIANQVQSLFIAIGAVFLMVLVFYRTLIGSIFCMIPIVLTVMLNFGIMGWLGIPIDIATVMVGSIAIGLGIDYAVHFFNRYREELTGGAERGDAIKTTLKTVGKAVVYNAAAVAVGFLVLPISEFEVLKSFGWLAAFAILFSALGALALLPDLLLSRRKILK